MEVVDGIGDRLGPQIARTGVGWSRYKVVDGKVGRSTSVAFTIAAGPRSTVGHKARKGNRLMAVFVLLSLLSVSHPPALNLWT